MMHTDYFSNKTKQDEMKRYQPHVLRTDNAVHSVLRSESSKPCFSHIVPLHVADIGSNGCSGSVVSRCRSRGDNAAFYPGRVSVHGEALLQRRQRNPNESRNGFNEGRNKVNE